MTTGDIIRNCRRARGLTQSELGEKIGMSKGTVINWELGRTLPNEPSMRLLAEIFQIDETDFKAGQIKECNILRSNEQVNYFLQANKLANQLVEFFAGKQLTENEKEAIMLTLQSAYLACKKTTD